MMVVVGVVSIWTFGMMVRRYARKALMRSASPMDLSTEKEKSKKRWQNDISCVFHRNRMRNDSA